MSKLRWKREVWEEKGAVNDDGVPDVLQVDGYVSGDFAIARDVNGLWALTHRGEEIARHKTKGECQEEAGKFATYYRGGGAKLQPFTAPFMMFDVKGEVALVGARMEGVMSVCKTAMRLLAARVVLGKGGRQVPDGPDGGAFETVLAASGVVTCGPCKVPNLATTELIGYPGEWVMCLLPVAEAE